MVPVPRLSPQSLVVAKARPSCRRSLDTPLPGRSALDTPPHLPGWRIPDELRPAIVGMWGSMVLKNIATHMTNERRDAWVCMVPRLWSRMATGCCCPYTNSSSSVVKFDVVTGRARVTPWCGRHPPKNNKTDQKWCSYRHRTRYHT